ncbi:MAG: lamin tail domain-containing protein [Verrucomicrobiae bacterium]|nr:lamin tail domain-containing protein [Verrucomicrobiae bacterium]
MTWTDQRTFRVVVPLTQRTNVLTLVGKDRRGNPVAGASDSITVTYTGAIERPEDFVVINEINYHPLIQGAGFVELYNRSTTTPFDLSGFRFDGIGYTFPAGAIIQPNSFLVLANDRRVFANAYGQTVPVFDEFPGTLDNSGEYLALVRPGETPAQDTVITDVHYDDRLPWPTVADGLGPSLQLIDPALGSWRVGNWSATATNDVNRVTPGRVNATFRSLTPFPQLWINEVLPQNLTSIKDASGENDPWIELYNAGRAAVDMSAFYLTDNYTNLTKWRFPSGCTVGAGQFLIVWADGEANESTPASPHTNFRLNPQTGSVALVRMQGVPEQPAVMDHVDYVLLSADRSYGSYPDGEPRRRRVFTFVTPGTTNNPVTPNVLVTINEFMAGNSMFPDPADGDFDDWFELFNASTEAVDLTGYTLTDNLSNPTKFRIPAGVVIPAGGFLLVWADEETGQTQPGRDLHVNFKLALEGESIGLFSPDGMLVDSVTFGQQTNNISMGRYPDGSAPPFVPMETPTPGRPNFLPGGNRPLVLSQIGDKEIGEMTLLKFTVTATDPDEGQVVTYTLGEDAPPGASIEPNTGVFTWTPSEQQGPGEYLFTIRATDNGKPPRTASERIKVRVFEINRPPVLADIPEQVIDEGSQLIVPLVASDPDYPTNSLTFALGPGAPDGAFIDPDGPAFVWTPSEAQGPGVYTIVIQVTDNGIPPLTGTNAFRVTVNEVNNPPEMPFISPQTVSEGSLFRLQVEARDPDGLSSLTFSLVRAPVGAEINPTTGLITWQTTEDHGPTNALFEVRATENKPPYLSTSRTFSVEVLEVNQAPILEPIGNVVVTEGETVRVQVTATDLDRPPQKLVFSLDRGAPAEASIDPGSGLLIWPIGADVGPSTNTITVRVTDDDLRDPKSSTRSFVVVVVAVPRIVINEIMYRAPVTGAEYVELHNWSTNKTWDISGWLMTGARFVFPAGTKVVPGGYVVVARDLAKFTSTYGARTNALGNYVHEIGSDGGVIELYRSQTPSPETLVDRVAFRASLPWPTVANGGGASLQLIDPRQDNSRVANWAAVASSTTNPPVNVIPIDATWRYWQQETDPAAGWTNNVYDDSAWPAGKALLYVETADLPAPKNTPLTLGRMSYYFRTKFRFDGYPTGASLQLRTVIDDGAVFYLNGKPVYWLGMAEGVIPERGTAATRTVGDATYEGPFIIPVDNLLLGENVLAVEVHQANINSSDIVFGAVVDVIEGVRPRFTPGFQNSVVAVLEPFPNVWINEVLPLNRTGITDNAGECEPWIELVNEGSSVASLEGWFLSDSFTTLGRWAFPAGSTLAPGTFKVVWADGEPGESTSAHWHTNFRLGGSSGVVVLSRTQGGQPAVVDFLEYSGVPADKSIGYLSSPSVGGRAEVLPMPTPGAANVYQAPPRFSSILVEGSGAVRIAWTAVIGKVYQVESKSDLGAGSWTVLGRVTATGAEAAFLDQTPVDAVRFYRVVMLSQ